MNKEREWREFGSFIIKLMQKKDLTRQEVKECWRYIAEGAHSDLQTGAFLALLHAKPETPEELAGTRDALMEFDTVKIDLETPKPFVNVAGTGADQLKTLNISTGAAIISASCGVYVAKHGARALTSKSGTIDVLEALGIEVDCDLELTKRSIEKIGIGTFSANNHKVAPKLMGKILSQIRFPISINLAGPLTHPAPLCHMVLGVFPSHLIDLEIKALKELGFKRAMVVHGWNEEKTMGMDEISTMGPTDIAELKDGKIETYTVFPEDFGIKRASFEELAGYDDLQKNTLSLLRVLIGRDRGPRRDILCLNAAAVLYIMDESKDLKEGFEMAKEAIEDGRTYQKLRQWVEEQNVCLQKGLRIFESLMTQVK